jgi:outer membrane protein OmpA-like peptidoglycan-associated protein
VVQNFKSNYLRNEVRIAIRDSISDDPIVANMTISNLGYDGNLFQGSDFVFDATNKGESEVFLNAKGYFIYSNKLNFNTGKDVYQKIKLVPLSTGLKLQMEGILFVQDSKEFLPSSQAALQRLLEFMVMNSDVKIEIRGHINAPGKKMNGKIKRLSKARAKNTYKFLMKNGISKDRISYKGMGNSEMLYPNPENNSEEQANRRVEILIL